MGAMKGIICFILWKTTVYTWIVYSFQKVIILLAFIAVWDSSTYASLRPTEQCLTVRRVSRALLSFTTPSSFPLYSVYSLDNPIQSCPEMIARTPRPMQYPSTTFCRLQTGRQVCAMTHTRNQTVSSKTPLSMQMPSETLLRLPVFIYLRFSL